MGFVDLPQVKVSVIKDLFGRVTINSEWLFPMDNFAALPHQKLLENSHLGPGELYISESHRVRSISETSHFKLPCYLRLDRIARLASSVK